MGEIRTPRRWQVLMQTLEYKGKVPQEIVVCHSIISVSMAVSIASRLGDMKAQSITHALYTKQTYFVKATFQNVNLIPWKPGYGYHHESMKPGYFLKHHVKVKFTLQPYDPSIVSKDAHTEHFKDPLPGQHKVAILENERETVCPPPGGSDSGEGSET